MNSGSHGGSARPALLLLIGGALLLGIGGLTVRYITIDLPSQLLARATQHAAKSARDVAAQIAAAFQVQPQVIVNRTTIVEQRTEVLQLVTLEQTLTERERIDDSWLHSTKTLEIEGDFLVRAGFDLSKPFIVRVDPSSGGLDITLPPPEIIATELREVRFLQDENGWWNAVTTADRERAIRELKTRVAARAAHGEILAQAQTVAERRLTELLGTSRRPISFTRPPFTETRIIDR